MTASRKRGFAAMNREQQRAIASKGGRAAHRKGTAHEFSSEEARKAGYLGGKTVSANREHMAAIGRRGGLRAGRSAHGQSHAEIAQRQDVNNENGFAESSVKEYIQPTGDTPPVVLPHWRETSIDRPMRGEEGQDVPQTERARELPPDEGSTASLSPQEE